MSLKKSSPQIEVPFIRALEFVLKWRKTFFIAHLVILFLGLFFLTRLKTELHLYSVVDPNFPSTISLQEMKKDFGSNISTQFIFSRDSGLTEKDLCRIKKWGQQNLEKYPALLTVSSLLDLREPRDSEKKLWYPLVSQLDCQSAEDRSAQELLKYLREKSYFKAFIDPGDQDFVLNFTFEKDAELRKDFGSTVGSLLESANTNLSPEIKTRIFGNGASRFYLNQAFAKDLLKQATIFLVVLILFKLIFGTWISGFIYILSIVLTMILTFGAMGLAGSPVDLMNNNLLLITAIAAMEDFIFLTLLHIKKIDQGWRKWFTEIVTPAFFTSLTTVIGFLSLTTSDLQLIQRFGFWCAFAALVEWWIIFYVFPNFLEIFRLTPSWAYETRLWKSRWIAKLENFEIPRSFAWGLVILAFLSPISLLWAEKNENMNRAFSDHHPFSETLKYWKKTRGWEGVLFLRTPPDSPIIDSLEAFRAQVSTDSNVLTLETPWDWEKHWIQNSPQNIHSLLVRELHETPFAKTQFSVLGDAKVSVYFKSLDRVTLVPSLDRLNSLCRIWHCQIAGEIPVFEDYSSKVPRTLLESFFTSLIFVALVLYPLCRYFSGSLKAVMLTCFLGPCLTLLLITVTRVPLSIPVSVLAAVLVGLTGDNAIQYLFGTQNGDLRSGIESRAKASVILTLILCLSSLLFLTMSQVAIQKLGPLFFFGFLFNLLGDLWILKALIKEKA